MSLPNVGDVFGPYKILRLLGRGGMGVVFLAEQQGLSRRVALKVLAPQLADKPEFRERFHREAGALAKLSAPHVVHVYDFGEHAGCLFIAMQYIDGEDLGSLIKDGPLPADLALDICEQIADALVDAHRLGVVHRDIKPSNILVERTPDMVRAYLCDFGIARLDNESHTQTGVLIGSYGYMSPEQCRGESATEASDLYALGCVLVACLVGRAPYPGTDIEVATKHLTAPAPYWEGTDPVTTVLNQAVGRLMAKEAGDRYPNAQAVKTALIDARRVVQGSVASQAELTELGATVVRPHVSNTVIRPNPPALAPMSQPPMAPVGVTQVRSSIPSHDPQPANFGPTPPKPKTNTPIIAIGATFALLLIVVTATAIIIVNKNDDNTSSTTTPVTTKVTPTTEPEPIATSKCWNGASIAAGQETCPPPRGEEALRFAFPLDWSKCQANAPRSYNDASFECWISGQPMHVASYRTPQGRVNRLYAYGFPRDCAHLGGGRLRCGPSPSGRIVRTYKDDRLLLYVSAPRSGIRALDRLPQRPEHELFNGVPQ